MRVLTDTIHEAISYWLDTGKPAVRRFTLHDLRSTMKSHMRALGVPRDISEMCLNRKLSGLEGIYDQTCPTGTNTEGTCSIAWRR